jgi:hypothetical protein
MNEKANKNGVFQEAETLGNIILQTENPCVGGSIPSLATFHSNHLQNPFSQSLPNVP